MTQEQFSLFAPAPQPQASPEPAPAPLPYVPLRRVEIPPRACWHYRVKEEAAGLYACADCGEVVPRPVWPFCAHCRVSDTQPRVYADTGSVKGDVHVRCFEALQRKTP